MTDYNIIPAVDENYNFPPQIQRNIASYPEFLEVRERLGDSETQLIAYSKELIQSRELIASVDSDLTRVKEVTIPQAVKTLEAVDQQASIELEALNGQLVSVEGEISSAKGRVEVLEGQIVDEQRARDELAQTTQQTFQDLDARLETFHDDESLAPIRNELIAAQEAVAAAQETADSASTAAESANTALLQMAGILDSKGRTLYQSTPPGPEDQSTSNLWIIPDTGQAHAWDDIAKEWVPFEDSGIKEAAQNAAAANSKAVAAQQTADTAIANASRAQAAAEAAQRTANQATTDAREAHNEAVAAQEAADDALNKYGPLDQRTVSAKAAADAAKARADEAMAEASEAKDLAGEAAEDIAQIQTSVNGKNSITRSTENASGSGVVAGDAWYKVDSNGDTMAMWIWSGSKWVASKVRNEMLDTVDVNKLKVHGTATMDTAVIDKLWVDGLVGKAATFQQMTVATGNLIPNGDFSQGLEFWRKSGWSVVDLDDPSQVGGNSHAVTTQGGTIGWAWEGPTFKMTGGEDYIFECWIRADKPNSRFFFEVRNQNSALVAYQPSEILEGGSGGTHTPYMMSNYLVPTAWTKYRMVFRAVAGTTAARVASLYFNHPNGSERNAQVWLTGISVRPKAGVVHIEDGQVNADKILASKELSAKVATFIEVETSSLVATKDVVTPEAVINKLWADGISAKSLTTSYLAVASSNLLANGNAESDAFWDTEKLPRVEVTDLPGFSHAFYASSATPIVRYPYIGPYSETQDSSLFPVISGEKYLFEMWIKAREEGTRFIGWLMDSNTSNASTRNKIVSPITKNIYSLLIDVESVPVTWTKYQVEVNINPGVTLAQLFNFTFNAPGSQSSQSGHRTDVWITGLSFKPMVGSTLIAPGAITTDKITVTEELSTNIANAMTVRTKELIVSEGATLNNAKVIGNLWAENFAAGKITTEMFSTSAAFSGPGVTINRTGINIGDTIYMNAASGFYARDSTGRKTFEISPSGTAKFSGEITSSAEITGSYIRTATSGTRLEMVGTTLKAFNSSNLETLRINSEGASYWHGDRKIGTIGETFKNGNTSVRGLANNLQYTGDYITWGYLKKPNDTSYTSMMTLDPKGRFYGHSGGGVYIDAEVKANNSSWNPSWSGFEVSVITISGNPLPAIKWGPTYLAFSTGAIYAVTNNKYYRIDKA